MKLAAQQHSKRRSIAGAGPRVEESDFASAHREKNSGNHLPFPPPHVGFSDGLNGDPGSGKARGADAAWRLRAGFQCSAQIWKRSKNCETCQGEVVSQRGGGGGGHDGVEEMLFHRQMD